MKKSTLKNYAKLIVQVGANVQRGQEVVIHAGLDQPDFVAMVAEECYRRGARKVSVDWNYQPVEKLDYQYQLKKYLGKVDYWEEERMKHYTRVLPVQIYIESDDPDGFRNVDQKKIAAAHQRRIKVLKPYRDAMDGRYQWCIAAVPGEAWARKVFPELSRVSAINKLWDTILTASRATGFPATEWEKHNKDLKDRCTYLNSLGIESLHYISSNGTDLSVGMIPEAEFHGGRDFTADDHIPYNPNIPSEECFISPMKGKAEGRVVSTMPLSYGGVLIEDFWIDFHEGKAVAWHAEKNEEALTNMINMDEGSAYLGECALVPYESPIRKTGILFYNTLFDENAACHLALGFGFADTIKDYGRRSLEECRSLGVNDSIIHVDFMIGCRDLSIVAHCRDGRHVQIFDNGTWAF